MTGWCLDASGSITVDELARACQHVLKFGKVNDLILVVSDNVQQVLRDQLILAEVHDENPLPEAVSRAVKGGFCGVREAVRIARAQGADRLVLLSDGIVTNEDARLFDEQIDIRPESERT